MTQRVGFLIGDVLKAYQRQHPHGFSFGSFSTHTLHAGKQAELNQQAEAGIQGCVLGQGRDLS